VAVVVVAAAAVAAGAVFDIVAAGAGVWEAAAVERPRCC